MNSSNTKVFQNTDISLGFLKNFKGNINVIQIVGDNAINKVAAQNGDLFAAMRYILSMLKDPDKLEAVKILALMAAFEEVGSWGKALKYLGADKSSFYGRRDKAGTSWRDKIRNVETNRRQLFIEEKAKES